MASYPFLSTEITQRIWQGVAIPAHPLALDGARRFDERRQQALTRYYLDAGAGGLAVGVHSTQFEIREPRYALLEPVLKLAAETAADWKKARRQEVVMVAGICGRAAQALSEARLARDLGYHVGLLSMSAFQDATDDEMIEFASQVAQEIPLFGFYLQPAAGGRLLSEAFWRRFCEIPNVVGIKIAPFNRYQTHDVIRAVAQSGRAREIALYTGNDDHIVFDLISEFDIPVNGQTVRLNFHGGLLGHWACWTRSAVDSLQRSLKERQTGSISLELIRLANKITDCNAAFFDAENHYKGALCGINEVLRRQGLLEFNHCLNTEERLSPGQAEKIDQVYRRYPELADDEFIQTNLDAWLNGRDISAAAIKRAE